MEQKNCIGCGVALADADRESEVCPACRTDKTELVELEPEPIAALAVSLEGTDPAIRLVRKSLASVIDTLRQAAPSRGGSKAQEEKSAFAPADYSVLAALEQAPSLVGREDVLSWLTGLCARAATTKKLVFAALTGQPGMGKSLLANSLAKALADVVPNALVVVSTCGSQGAPPFAAFARMFALRAGITDGDAPSAARSKIETYVSAMVPAARALEATHLIARLAGVPFPDGSVIDEFAERAQQLEARTFIAVRRLLSADAMLRPMVLVFDDFERARPETLRLVRYLAAGLEATPLTLLVVGRPNLYEEHPSLAQADDALEKMELGPLSPDASERLFLKLTRFAGDAPSKLAKHARERLGGSPRTIVELVRYLVETGGIKRAEEGANYSPTSSSTPAAASATFASFDRARFARSLQGVPSSLEELLAARLQAMAPARRELLEKAAACGEIFWLDAVVAIARAAATSDPDGPPFHEIETEPEKGGDHLREGVASTLSELSAMGLVVASPHARIVGEREFHFAYPPWWDVVYKSLSAQVRKRYHRHVAQWLELRPEGRGDAEQEQEEVGRHLEAAGDGDGAAARYRRGGDGARARYYNDEAIRLYERALACASESDLGARINLFHDLGSVHQLKGEIEPARRAFERMLRLAWLVASRSKAAVAWSKLGRIYRQRGELKRALGDFERALDLFTQVDDERGCAGALDDMAQVLWLLGRYDEAHARGTTSLLQRRRLGDPQSIALSLLTIAHIQRHRGLFKEADTFYREALAIRRTLDDRVGIASSLNGLAALAFQRGDHESARGHWHEALRLAEDAGALPVLALIEGHLGEVARALGNTVEARTRFERSKSAARELDDKRLLSEALRNLSLLELADAELSLSRELAQQAYELADEAGIRVDVGRALVTLGEIHSQTLFRDQGEDGQGDGLSSAEDFFRRAVELFREIGNAAELGVALDRYGSWRIERGELEKGKELIAEAQEIFSRLGMRAFSDAARRMMTEIE